MLGSGAIWLHEDSSETSSYLSPRIHTHAPFLIVVALTPALAVIGKTCFTTMQKCKQLAEGLQRNCSERWGDAPVRAAACGLSTARWRDDSKPGHISIWAGNKQAKKQL